MHINGKKMAFSGLILALAVVLIILAGVIQMNTLFLLAASAFTVGVIACEFGMKYAIAYWVAALILSFFVAPNKLHCITFSAMALYILFDEALWLWLQKHQQGKNKAVLLWVGKFIVFNIMYLPMLIFFPKLLFGGEISNWFLIIALIFGQVFVVLFDRAYDYFQRVIWVKYRKFLD